MDSKQVPTIPKLGVLTGERASTFIQGKKKKSSGHTEFIYFIMGGGAH